MSSSPVPIDIRHLDQDQITEALSAWGEPAFRARQIWQWLWQKGSRDFASMTNLPLGLRERLQQQFVINGLVPDKSQFSEDGTIKNRYVLHDGFKVESVLIPVPDEQRFTACVSCQVGCSLTCSFCATGQMKRVRNLDPGEIVDQVEMVNAQSMERFGHPLTNIVFMGMGEPLLAYGPVMQSIERITAPDGLGFSPRRITLSTAGIAKMIRRLADDNPKVNLALSLHAADDAKRDTIMPINEQNNLESLMDALDYFYRVTRNRITYEYIAFNGFNDTLEDARNLARLTHRFPVRVNIIEYNPVEGVEMEKSPIDRLDTFAAELTKLGVTVTVRRSRGKDIDAACGQLANKD
ncbi:MAG: 23S rRNA (adenine(2503)-C(2))-methyltransferase RlmN [Saprospiraceae bacterium]